MKKSMEIGFALLFLLAWAGCANTAEKPPVVSKASAPDSDTAVLKEPPALTVVCGDQSVEANRGAISWTHENADGISESVHSDSLHPLQAKEFMPSLELPADASADRLEASLPWDAAPDEVSVHCWSEVYWDEPDAESEEIAVNTQMTDGSGIVLKDGNYIYEIVAEWNGNEKYGGTASYSFYTVKASE